jgi:hypothetical protein
MTMQQTQQPTTEALPQQSSPPTMSASATGPSRDDAAALIQLATLHAQLQVSAGLDVLWRSDFPTDPYTIDAWFAPGTDGRRGLEAVLVWFQTVGTLVRHGLLDAELCRDFARADLVWERIGAMAIAQRARTGDDTMWANFEHLAASHAPADRTIDLDG